MSNCFGNGLVTSKSFNNGKKKSLSVFARQSERLNGKVRKSEHKKFISGFSKAYPVSYINLNQISLEPVMVKSNENSPSRNKTPTNADKYKKLSAFKFSKNFFNSLHYQEILNFRKQPMKKNFVLTSKKIRLIPSPLDTSHI